MTVALSIYLDLLRAIAAMLVFLFHASRCVRILPIMLVLKVGCTGGGSSPVRFNAARGLS
jgi:hypothetical protein